MVEYPAMVDALVQSERFLPPNVSAGIFEFVTLLGPFFAISPLQGAVTIQYFGSPQTRDKSYILNSQRALRMTLNTHNVGLLNITNRIIKSSTNARARMLDWFATSININHKRRAMQVVKGEVSQGRLHDQHHSVPRPAL